MRIAILLNRDRAKTRTLAKRVLLTGHDLIRGRIAGAGQLVVPEYDSLAYLLDPEPLVLGMDEKLDFARLAQCDLLIWEWGWTPEVAKRLIEIREKVDVTTLVFPGPLDLFWRELDIADLPLHLEAARRTDVVGVMLEDMVGFYRDLMPHAHVFHLPVPVDAERLAALGAPAGERDPNSILLTAPTRVAGPATHMSITTLLSYRSVAARRPSLRGLAYGYSDDDEREAKLTLEQLGMTGTVEVRNYTRPIQRFIEQIKHCYAGMLLSNNYVQGRMAMIAACVGIPMVVSDHVETHRRLFPQCAVPWYDTAGAAAMLERLLDDGEFHRASVSSARSAIADYSPARVRDRMMDAIESVSPGLTAAGA